MSVHGFWSKREAQVRDAMVGPQPKLPPLTTPPGRPDPYDYPEGTWRDHPDRAAVERAEAALPLKQEQRRDG